MFQAGIQYRLDPGVIKKQQKRLLGRGKKAVRKGLKLVQKRARSSMRHAKRGDYSSPGTPPHSHTRKKGSTAKKLKEMIKLAPESELNGVVGPIAQWARIIAQLHERGGTQQKTIYEFERKGKNKKNRVFLTRRKQQQHYRGRLNSKLKREGRHDVLARIADREDMRGSRGERGYDPKAVDHNENSRRKMEKGLPPISEGQLRHIREYYTFEKAYLEEKYLKRTVPARYKKRPFMKPALLNSLPEIESALRGD